MSTTTDGRDSAERLEVIAAAAQPIDTETLQNVIVEMADLLRIAFRQIERLEAKAGL